MVGVILETAKNLIDDEKLVSFGSSLGEQVDVLNVELEDGKTILNEFYNGSKAKAFEDLLNNGLCYVEVPSSRWNNGEQVLSYDKYLATRSEDVMKSWLGVDELAERYTRNFGKIVEEGYSFIVKPVMGKGEDKPRRVSVPTKPVELKNEYFRLYPVPVIVYLFTKLHKLSENGLIRVEYMKDNRTKRVINMTSSRKILENIYNSKEHVDLMLGDVTEDLRVSSTLERGYARVAEADSSKYDLGVRALNLARICNYCNIDINDLDLTYIDVNLDDVTAKFSLEVRKMNPTQLQGVANAMKGWKYPYSGGYAVHDLESFVLAKESIHTTTFRKDLWDLMVSLPQYFNLEEKDKVECAKEKEDDLDFLVEDDFSLFE